ncbi:MAG TPA: trypsin-like peptidase domain-containing protein [Actinomycetota bacterium]
MSDPEKADLPFELALAPEPDEDVRAVEHRLPAEPHAELDLEPPMDGPISGEPEPAEEPPTPFWDERLGPPHRSFAVVVLVALIAAVLGAAAGAVGAFYAFEDRVSGGSVVRVSPPIEDPPDEPANAAAAVAEAVLPNIVQIDVAGDFGQQAVGSGVIYRSDGYIITNDHVVRDADEIQVRLPSGDRLPGALVGTAMPVVDIAVIKVAREGLPAATFGTSNDLRVGELAVAIGSPFGLEATVTSGVISALHRNALQGAASGIPDAIQTDAAINPGNSGGALANINGEVIGINTAILGSDVGGNVGIGFAIPIDTVRKVADQIIETGTASLPFLGIEGSSIPGRRGALVSSVLAGAPAARAGLRAEDVIVGMDGRTISSFEELISYLITKDVGDRVSIIYVRDGERRTTTATLAERSER